MPIEHDEDIAALLESARTIAIVGASDKAWRDSHDIMLYLLGQGYRVFPVNPRYESIMGIACTPDVQSIPEHVDIVDVFRRSEAVAAVVDDALAARASALWLQLGVIDETSSLRAEKNGMKVVEDRCIAVDHRRLIRFARRNPDGRQSS